MLENHKVMEYSNGLQDKYMMANGKMA